jgi:hypothetical protein
MADWLKHTGLVCKQPPKNPISLRGEETQLTMPNAIRLSYMAYKGDLLTREAAEEATQKLISELRQFETAVAADGKLNLVVRDRTPNVDGQTISGRGNERMERWSASLSITLDLSLEDLHNVSVSNFIHLFHGQVTEYGKLDKDGQGFTLTARQYIYDKSIPAGHTKALAKAVALVRERALAIAAVNGCELVLPPFYISEEEETYAKRQIVKAHQESALTMVAPSSQQRGGEEPSEKGRSDLLLTEPVGVEVRACVKVVYETRHPQ